MDITSIINSDDAPQSRKPSIPISAKQEHRSSLNGFPDAQAPVYDNRRNIRPPQPAPLQTPAYSGPHYATASPHDNLRSPYHGTSSFSSSSGQYPPPQAPHQSPRYSHQNLQYPQRENSATSGPHSGRSFGQSTPLNQTPNTSTPGSANIHSGFPRPSSSHSIPTPNSSRNPSSFLKESPQPLPPQSRTFSQPYGAPQYVSQPGTPLGPPSTHGRSSINSHQTSPGEYHHQRTYSGGYHGHQEPAGPPAVTNMSPSAYREHHPGIQANLKQHERQESLSVSPKTRLPSLPSINRMSPIREPSRSDLESTEFVAPIKREHESNGSTRYSESQPTRRPSHPVGMMSLLNEEPSQESPERIYQPSQVQNHPHIKHNGDSSLVDHSTLDQRFTNHSSSPSDQDSRQSQILPAQQSPLAHQSHHSPPRHDSNQSITQTSVNAGGVSSFKMAALKTSNSLLESKLPSEKKTSRGSKNAKRSIQDASEIEASEDSILAESQPVRKKPRTEGALKKPLPVPPQQDQYQVQVKTKKVPRITHWQDVPIFARSIRGPDRTMKLFQQNLTGSIPRSHVSQTNGNTKLHAQVPQQPPPANGIMSSVTPLPPSGDGPLGPWEVSFTDTIPADEVTRIIADYLFLNVVRNNDVGVAPAGGGRGLGAVLEIEAKIGRLIDKTTNDRLRLPVLNECVVDLADPNMRLKFESSMTEVSPRQSVNLFNTVLIHLPISSTSIVISINI